MYKIAASIFAILVASNAWTLNRVDHWKHEYAVQRDAKFELARRLATSKRETQAALASRQTVADWDLSETNQTASQCAAQIRAAVAATKTPRVFITKGKVSYEAPSVVECPNLYRLRDVQIATGNVDPD